MVKIGTITKQNIADTICLLGYAASEIKLKKVAYRRYKVYSRNGCIGIWDITRRTFVN